MPPQFETLSESAAGSSTSRSVATPAGVQPSDIIMFVAYLETTNQVTAPAEVAELTPIVSVTGSGAHTLRIFWRRLAGTDFTAQGAPTTTSWAFSWTSSVYSHFWAGRYSSVAPAGNPFDNREAANAAVRSTTGTTLPPVRITPTGPGRLGVHVGFSFKEGTMTGPDGWASRDASDISLSDRVLPAGDSGPLGGTGPSAPMTAWVGALLPAADTIEPGRRLLVAT